MIENATVNLAPFLNFIIYVVSFILIILLFRWLIRLTYGRRVMRICKSKVMEVMSTHYKNNKFNKCDLLEDELRDINISLKRRFGLHQGPIDWLSDDIHSMINYNTISDYFKLRYIIVYKKFLLYNMKIIKFERFSKDVIVYKNCLVESRDNKINDLLK